MRKFKILLLAIFFLNLNLYSCENISFEALTHIEKSGLSNCDNIKGNEIDDFDVKLAAIQTTFKKLLTAMSIENREIGEKLYKLSKKTKKLKNYIQESKNTYKIKDNIKRAAEDIQKELENLKEQINKSSKNLRDVQDKMTNTFCVIKKSYIYYKNLKESARDLNTKNNYQHVMNDLNKQCTNIYNILKHINTFFESFEELNENIISNHEYIFSLASSVISFVANKEECHPKGCKYNRTIELRITLNMLDSYKKNTKILIEINTNTTRILTNEI